MMPSRARLASATAAGVVGLAVAGMILFGTDPLGTGSAVIAVPAPAAASGAPTETEAEPLDQATAKPNRRPWRPQPTGTASGKPQYTYKPGSWNRGTYRPPTTYGPRPAWRASRRPTARPRPTATAPTVAPGTTAPRATPTTTR